MKYRPKHIAEYIFLRAIVGLINILPYRCALAIGWTIAWCSHFLFRFRVRVAKRRIRELLGEGMSDRQVAGIAWISWRNFIFTCVDLVRMPHITAEWVKKHIIGWESVAAIVEKYCASGRGSVFVTPHTGAWELCPPILQKLGLPMFVLVGQQKNPLADAYINKMRGSTGLTSVTRGSGFLREVIRRLKTSGYLGFLPDVRAKTDGITISFFGRDAVVPVGMSLFAYQANVPITFGLITRVGWTRHHLVLYEPIEVNRDAEKKAEWQRLTNEVFARVETAVRNQPEQWFWYNKRWILDPIEKSEQHPAKAVESQDNALQADATRPPQ